MERKVSEVIWRLDLHFVTVEVDEPAKRTDGKDREARYQQPEPDKTIPLAGRLDHQGLSGATVPTPFPGRLSFRNILDFWFLSAKRRRGSEPIGKESRHQSDDNGESRHGPAQTMGGQSKDKTRDGRCVKENQSRR